ncbi:hypothetical protein ACIBEA_39185 [Streptomyces sp. NPDC051555]|uniref:hypothetical protein n=1 Tax=Streptomyces sp. NPDC051555 TaxID=3365657 RepID=UPI0037BCA7D4
MNAQPTTAVAIAARGLGTRVAGWSPFLPKESRPVGGRPDLMHVPEESAAVGAARAVAVHHPYYALLSDWASRVVAPGALAQELVQQPIGQQPLAGALRAGFIGQQGLE